MSDSGLLSVILSLGSCLLEVLCEPQATRNGVSFLPELQHSLKKWPLTPEWNFSLKFLFFFLFILSISCFKLLRICVSLLINLRNWFAGVILGVRGNWLLSAGHGFTLWNHNKGDVGLLLPSWNFLFQIPLDWSFFKNVHL